jgi:crossover junction endodeoxyribonuclease RuvC
MIILGIDPGTIITGYGVIKSDDDMATPVAFGIVKPGTKLKAGERLSFLYKELGKIIRRYHPDAVAVEQPFVAKNVSSAFLVGRAQAVALLAAANAGIPAYEYTPAQVKQRVASYGASSKEQIQEMVRLQMGLTTIPEPSDAADALAVALCHLHEMHLQELIKKGDK